MGLLYDLSPDAINGRRVAVLGYGAQGHAHALNLRDSGASVVIGLPATAARRQAALDAGFEVREPALAVAGAEYAALLVPDETMREAHAAIAPALEPGAALVFAHGFALHYGQVVPRADCDALLVAPKGQGRTVRSAFVAGGGVPAIVSAFQDASGAGRERALAYAAGLGAGRAGIVEASVAEETEADLFSEQAVLCGGVTQLVRTGFEVLVEAGYSPEVAYFECLHELKLVVDLLHEGGLSGMHRGISNTAEYGDRTAGPRLQELPLRKAMREILAGVRSGSFARAWLAEAAAGAPTLAAEREAEEAHPIERVGRELRSRMVWGK
ncbi:MAG: ketol-acid reductoisomerase [Candidatus Sericytochromatia bacterium]|nr:ketol-acid reductoisomerase [Candidatus Tanganyikabacteria bacterium]